MKLFEAWKRAYARQAKADLLAYDALARDSTIPRSQSLHMLQMACEKLCKAHLCENSSDPADLQSSHKYVAKNLPVIARQYVAFYQQKPRHQLLRQIRQLAREIELLAPAVDDSSHRPDNCEYPWEDATGGVHVPAEYSFPNLSLLFDPAGRTLLKIVQWGIDRLAT